MDSSTNIVPWGILIGGEELHNNHHVFASSARFSAKRWELDIGWLYISLLAMVGLAKVKKLAPSPQMDREKTALDLDTLTALVGSRFHVMADYAKHVLKTVHREELKKAETGIRRQLKATGSLLGRDRSLMNDKQRLCATSVNNCNKSLPSARRVRSGYSRSSKNGVAVRKRPG